MAFGVGSAIIVSMQSIGTYIVMLVAGVILKRMGLFSDDLSKGLAQLSAKLTIPALLFVNMLNCNQDYSNAPCPDLVSTLASAWPLFLWPLFVVGIGLSLGRYIVLTLGKVPENFRKTAMVAVAFGNSTGMTITLLTAIHRSFNPSSDPLGIVDPTVHLSVYLLLYPLLQWAVGGSLIGMYKPTQKEVDNSSCSTVCSHQNERGNLSAQNLPLVASTRENGGNVAAEHSSMFSQQLSNEAAASGEEACNISALPSTEETEICLAEDANIPSMQGRATEQRSVPLDHSPPLTDVEEEEEDDVLLLGSLNVNVENASLTTQSSQSRSKKNYAKMKGLLLKIGNTLRENRSQILQPPVRYREDQI